MLAATCAHCGTPIVDESTKIADAGNVYCCPNCRTIAGGAAHPASPGHPICAHCGEPLVDASTQVERTGQTFGCPNCAAAAAMSA
jgi:predicted RNA-binding Zn-ribbon protein involved in translation (DUF1610 family)